MTSRELRTRRRAEERKTRKSQTLGGRSLVRAGLEPRSVHHDLGVSPETLEEFGPEFIAQANLIRERIHSGAALLPAQPTESAATAPPSGNSFQHGLASGALVVSDEDPAEFDELRASLRQEHQPANTTEEILVDELAQSFWRMRRFREFETRAFQPENLDDWSHNGLMTLIQRSLASAERSFYRSLTALQNCNAPVASFRKKPLQEQPPQKKLASFPQNRLRTPP